jgi:hypothetical protein
VERGVAGGARGAEVNRLWGPPADAGYLPEVDRNLPILVGQVPSRVVAGLHTGSSRSHLRTPLLLVEKS